MNLLRITRLRDIGAGFLVGLVVATALLVSGQASEDSLFGETATHDESQELAVLGAINDWRMGLNLAPLKPNFRLQNIAFAQATYLASLPELPESGEAFHVDGTGLGIHERAQAAPYSWANYGRSDRVAVAEIAGVGSLQSVITFWQTSSIHSRSATNAVYREVGIAALPHEFGHLYIVVFGGRPNVLPALIHPLTGELHLTSELSTYANHPNWIGTASEYKLFDADGRPLTADWQPWTRTLRLPANITDDFFVLYSDGNTEVLHEVETDRDLIFLPDFQSPVLAELPQPTATPLPTSTPAFALQATPVPATAAPAAQVSVLLVYDSQSLTLVNVADQRLDLSPLKMVGREITSDLNWWSSLREIPVASFPAGDCVTTWTSGVDFNSLQKPASCNFIQSARASLADESFWIMGDFRVFYGDQEVALCSQSATKCEVRLPS